MTPNWEWQQRTETNSVLIVRGDLDVAVGVEFVGAVDKVLAGDGSTAEVVIELGEVDFIDSSGLRALLQLRHNYGDRVQVGAISARRSAPARVDGHARTLPPRRRRPS